jgi:hypothetical protein
VAGLFAGGRRAAESVKQARRQWRRLAKSAGREAVLAAFFLGLALVATRPLAKDLVGHTVAGWDPASYLWSLNWSSGHLLPPRDLFGGNIFFPAHYGLLYSDVCLGSAVLVLPLRLVVRDPVLLFNLGMLLVLAFSGWSFHLLARTLSGSTWAGLLTGVLAGFGSGQMNHLYHFNLLGTGWIALSILGLHRLVERPSWGAVVLTGVSFSLSAQSSGYYAVAIVVIGCVFVLTHLEGAFVRSVRGKMLAAGLLAAGLTLPYLLAYLDLGRTTTLTRTAGQSYVMALHLTRDMGSPSYLYRGWFGPDDGAAIFPGFLSLTLAAIVVIRRPKHARFYLTAIGALILASLGPALELGGKWLPLPYDALRRVPPFDSMRHPVTFAAVVDFLVAVLAGVGWVTLPIARRVWAGPLLIALAVGETLSPGLEVAKVPPGIPPAYGFIEGRTPASAQRPGIFEVNVFSSAAVISAARHGLPVANGIGAFWPPYHGLLDLSVRNHWLRKPPRDVDHSKPTRVLLTLLPEVRYVIVPAGGPELERLAGALRRSRTFAFLAEFADGSSVYEIRRPPDGPLRRDPGAAVVPHDSVGR